MLCLRRTGRVCLPRSREAIRLSFAVLHLDESIVP